MRIVFTDDKTEDEILVSFQGDGLVPRIGESVFVDDVLYKVTNVIHWIDIKKPDNYIEIMLLKDGRKEYEGELLEACAFAFDRIKLETNPSNNILDVFAKVEEAINKTLEK